MLLTIRRHLLPTALVSGLLLAVGTAAAALVAEIKDDGGFFSPAAIAKANEVIKEIHRDFKKDLLIETFKTVPADRAEEVKKMDKAELNKFFQAWALQRARAAQVNGVYILISKEPPHLQVEVGNETQQKAFTLANRDELARRVIAKFKQAAEVKDDEAKRKFYDEGLLEGVNYVYSTMKSNIGVKGAGLDQPAVPRHDQAPWQQAPQRKAGGGIMEIFGGLGGLLCIGLIIGLVVWVFIGLIRAFTHSGGGGYSGGPGYGGGMGGGGGFMTGLLGGMFGAVAGSWLYDSFFRSGGGSGWGGGSSSSYGGDNSGGPQREDTDYSGTGGDYSGNDAGGGDAGGGGGDFGGGGGDFGGGGGGDFGGGGGDFGGGGGDFGGGGGGGGGDF